MIDKSKIDKFINSGLALLLVLFIAGILVSGCTQNNRRTEKPILTVSILPQKFFVEKIAGDQFKVNVMIPPGESPATYDPTPQQMAELIKSEIYFRIGYIEFEKTWIREFETEHGEVRFFDTSRGVDLLTSEFEHGDHTHIGVEPHIWMSVINVKQIAENMTDDLESLYPENEQFYNDNLKAFHKELDSVHAINLSAFENIELRQFIIYHPALTYYAKDYDLVQIPLEREGKEPGVSYMKTVIQQAIENNTRAILVQKQFNQEEARVIEKEISGKIILIDPLDYSWDKQMNHIRTELISILTDNIEN